MLNLFKRPFHRESLDSWAKSLDDIAKVAILAVPVVLYGEKTAGFKSLNVFFLAICAYCCLFAADFVRKQREILTMNKE